MAEQEPPQEENRNGGRPRRQRDREDQVPVEELFDLSKPIPKARAFFAYTLLFTMYMLSYTLTLSIQ